MYDIWRASTGISYNDPENKSLELIVKEEILKRKSLSFSQFMKDVVLNIEVPTKMNNHYALFVVRRVMKTILPLQKPFRGLTICQRQWNLMLYIQPNMLINYVIFKNKLINVNVIEMRIHAANMTFFLNKENIIPLQQISITPGLQKNTKI